ncbi:MAG: glycosyltransferase family 4 protein [Candidatus Magasanikbacteria bacterium]
MKIGIDIRSLMSEQRTGVGGYTYHLLDNLFELDSNHSFYLFYNSHKDVSVPRWDHEHVHTVAFNYPNKLLNLSGLLLGRPKLDRMVCRKADIESLDFFFAPNLNFTPLSDEVKFILTIHDLSFKYFSEFLTAKRKLGYLARKPEQQVRRADVTLTPSDNTKQDIERTFDVDSDKVKRVYPAVDDFETKLKAKEVKTKYSLPDDFILFLGSLEPRKNVNGLLEAYRQADIKEDYKLVIAGAEGWKSKKTKDRIKHLDNVDYIGYIEEAEKPVLFELADLFVYPSFYEGFGFPVLEAMASSTPVITSERSSLPEISEGAAYLIDPRIKSELSKAMELILNDQQLYDSYVQSGLEQVKKFDWKQTAAKFLEVCSR